AVSAEHALHEGGARTAVRAQRLRRARRPARRAPERDACAHQTQERGRPRRSADLRSRALPPRGGPAVARAHRRAPRRTREGGALMTKRGTPLLIGKGLDKSFGSTRALDGA